MKTKILALFLLILLSACNSIEPVAPPTATSLPPTPSSTPSPTQTPSPTLTPTPTPLLPLSGSGGGVIAYTFVPASGGMQLNLINLDGSENRKLLGSSFGFNHADWSPDGQKIATVGYMDSTFTTWSIHVFSADGSNKTRLTNTTGAADSEPAWSPDGTQILFTRIEFTSSNQYRSALWLMNADGSDQRMVVADGFAGKWSPDGTRLIYSSNKAGNYELYTSSTDGTNEQRLTNTSADESYPAWSPDGKQIAFSVSTGEWNSLESVSSYEIYVMNADGTEKRQLTDNAAYDGNPRWSPDGSQLVFTSDRSESGHYDVYVMEADGTNTRQVTHTPSGARAINPFWRPERNLSFSTADLTTIIPWGNPTALDGIFSPGEWDRALRQEVTDDGEVLLMQDGDYLYLGVHENFDGLTVTTVCMEYDGEVSLLHSSGSLGTAIFENIGSDWQLIQPFAWELYNVTSHTGTAENQRQAFLESYGWLANLGSMTETEQIEYKISIPDGAFHIAVAYLLPPDGEQVAWWPAGLADDCRRLELLQGNSGENQDPPLLMQFAPETWVTFNLEYQQSEE